MKDLMLARGASRIIRDILGVQEGELVVVVTDLLAFEIGLAIAVAAHAVTASVVTTIMEPTGAHGLEPPAPVGSAMKVADAVLMPVTWSLVHTDARRRANAAGARVAALSGVTLDQFVRGLYDIDVENLAKRVHFVGSLMEAGSTARLQTPSGTDLTMELGAHKSVNQSPLCRKPGEWIALPVLEAAVCPKEGTTNGTAVIDGAVVPGGPLFEPITLRLQEGRIQAIEGGTEAQALEERLLAYGCRAMYEVVELGVGLHPKARIGMSYAEDEAELGTAHLGIGDGESFGSAIRAPSHLDLVMRNALLEIDGRVVLAEGELRGFPVEREAGDRGAAS